MTQRIVWRHRDVLGSRPWRCRYVDIFGERCFRPVGHDGECRTYQKALR